MSRNSDYFKKIQLNLFDFLNQNPISKFKDKDLLGPLKHLKEHLPEILDEVSALNESLINPKNVNNKPVVIPEASAQNNFNSQNTLFDLPVHIHRKPYIRHLRFSVRPNGTIHVIAPMNRPEERIFSELKDYKDWILNANQKYQKLRSSYPVKKFTTGEVFPFLGENFYLKLTSSDFKKPFIQLDLDQIQFFYPEKWDLLQKSEKQNLLKRHFMDFYQTQAITQINQRVRKLSEYTGLYPKKVNYRNQKTRWGSCSSNATVTLNWKLIAFDQSLIDYVVIHELCHMTHPNHSAKFWALVEKFCPDYKRLNKQLNQNQFQVDFLAPESELYFMNPCLV